MPRGFHDRGFTVADFDDWEQMFYDALSEGDQPLSQALAQGEIDRCSTGIGALSSKLASLTRQQAIREMPTMRREIDHLQQHLSKVGATVNRHKKR